jgi:hypothetical protein
MSWPLKNDFKPDFFLKDLGASWLNTVANFCNELSVINGFLSRNPEGRSSFIEVDTSAAGAGFEVRGTPSLNQVIAYREYVNDVLVEAGSETGAGVLIPTADYVRATD